MSGERPRTTDQISSAWLAEQVTECTAAGIASTLGELIRSGMVSPGARLPTVREFAIDLHVSPASVSAAWSQLRKRNVISGKGRQGSWVSLQPMRSGPQRYGDIDTLWSSTTRNLVHAVPDRGLLPNLRPALHQAVEEEHLHSYYREPITAPLEHAIQQQWPSQEHDFLVTNGGYEGLRLLLTASVMPGERVAVADPAAARMLDILENIGARPIPVATDNEGPVVESLRHALAQKPVAFIYEPRCSSLLGVSVSSERRDALAAELSGAHIITIEDDGVGDIAEAPYYGVAGIIPEHTILVRSYSKSHGPDLRTAVIGATAAHITPVNEILQFGSGWTSRILQNTLAYFLQDPETVEAVRHARATYTQRRELLVRLLGEHGVTVTTHDGLVVSVPVLSEQHALLVLASHGIAALGAGSVALESSVQAVRLPVGQAFESPERIAEIYALAAKAS